ncbi:MAG TPA: hypothetical protein VIP70_02105 [Nitrososphaeraceae archaeon]
MQIKYNNTADAVALKEEEEEQNQLLNPYTMFKYSIRSELTRKYYERRLKKFLDFIQFEIAISREIEKRCNDFAEKGKSNIDWAINQIIRFLHFQKERVENENITAATLKNFIKSLKVFCDCADLDIPWKKITRGLPKGTQAANDRAPTIEEIRKLVEYPDRRIKPIVYTMVSSGIRLGAWDYFQWKHIEPITKENGEVVAAKLRVYVGDIEEYYTFITAEAYNSLKEWMDFRASYGEKITGTSWLMRDLWQTTNMNYGARWGLATSPKKLKSSGIKRLLERAIWEQGIRQPLTEGVKRHEWKAAHGFRKFYKSRAEQIMRPINVEITMGHDIGISASYYKPTEHEVLDDYLKAIDLLTINDDKLTLQKQVTELTEKSKEENYIIKGKLSEKEKEIDVLRKQQEERDDALTSLSDQVMKLMAEVQELKNKNN